MGIFSRFEGKVEDTFEGAANKMFDSPISPVQIAKKAEKQMRREKMVGAGKQYAPTLYTVLVNAEDDQRLFGYYPTLAGETETYLMAKASADGLVMDGHPLVRFIADDDLKRGKFEVIAELVAAPIIQQLRSEEMARYGFAAAPTRGAAPAGRPQNRAARAGGPMQPPVAPPMQTPQAPYGAYGADDRPPLPYVPEDEIEYGVDYGEYTFDSQDFEDYQNEGGTLNPGYDTFDEDGYAPGGAGVPGQPFGRRPSVPLQQPNPAVGVDGYAAAAVGAGMAAGAVNPPAQGTPNTVVFAAGSKNAQPTPQGNMVRARLMNTTDNRSYDLATARLIIGRDSSSDVVVDDINASRSHAEIKFEPQGVWVLTDLGSTNGTLLNGREVVSQVLNDGDYVTIGMTNFVFMQA